MRRVVITGIGIWSCIGTSINEVKDSLYNGKSGIIFDQSRIDYGYQCGLIGNVPIPNIDIDRKIKRTFTQESSFAYMASKQALDVANINTHQVGCIFSNDGGNQKNTVEIYNKINKSKNSKTLGSYYVFQGMNSNITMNLCTALELKGISLTISSACAGGSHAIGIATTLIRSGMQDIILCGGAQDIQIESFIAFDASSTFSLNNENPEKASRPFDKSRDGLVPSGGAAALVLEEYEHAVKRGAIILGEVIGYGFSSNGSSVISAPSALGSFISIKKALRDANLMPSDIDYINAHATSTPQGDACEARALNKLFKTTPISSTKSMTGHECWMSGASEVVYSLIMMNNNFIAPNINLEDSEFDLNIIKETTNIEINTILSNSFGFGGTNSTLIIKKI